MAETEKKYTTAYGKLRRLTSTIDGQIRQISVSDSRVDSTMFELVFIRSLRSRNASV